MKARTSSAPPKTMTWPKAMPIVLVALIFDIARAFFNFFWLFGPAMLAAGVGSAASNATPSLPGSTVSSAIGAGAGALTGLAAGYFGAPVFMFFGVVMAMAVGLLGWMSVIVLLLFFNTRIFSPSSFITMLLGFSLSELPFISALPALTGTTLRLFHVQIKREHKALEVWKKEEAALKAQREAEYLAFLVESEQAHALAEEEGEVADEVAEEEMLEEEEQEQEEERRAADEAEEEENEFREAA